MSNPTVDQVVRRLAVRIDPRTKAGQVPFNDKTAAIAVTATANSGGNVKLTTASAHGMISGNECYISDIVGTTEANNTLANPAWTATVVDPTNFTIPVTYANAWVSGGTVTPAMVCSSRGALEPAELLDIYNRARFAAFAALRAKYGDDRKTFLREVGALLLTTTVNFSGTGPTSADIPTGYIDWQFMYDANGTITLYGPIEAQAALDNRPNYTDSAVYRHVYETNDKFVHPKNFVNGSTTLQYFGVSAWTLAQVLAGTTIETYGQVHIDNILELGSAIAQSMGGIELNALSARLFGAKG